MNCLKKIIGWIKKRFPTSFQRGVADALYLIFVLTVVLIFDAVMRTFFPGSYAWLNTVIAILLILPAFFLRPFGGSYDDFATGKLTVAAWLLLIGIAILILVVVAMALFIFFRVRFNQ